MITLVTANLDDLISKLEALETLQLRYTIHNEYATVGAVKGLFDTYSRPYNGTRPNLSDAINATFFSGEVITDDSIISYWIITLNGE